MFPVFFDISSFTSVNGCTQMISFLYPKESRLQHVCTQNGTQNLRRRIEACKEVVERSAADDFAWVSCEARGGENLPQHDP